MRYWHVLPKVIRVHTARLVPSWGHFSQFDRFKGDYACKIVFTTRAETTIRDRPFIFDNLWDWLHSVRNNLVGKEKELIEQIKSSAPKMLCDCSRNIATHFYPNSSLFSHSLLSLFDILFAVIFLPLSLFLLLSIVPSCSSIFFDFSLVPSVYRFHFEWQTTVIPYIAVSHKTLVSHKIRMVDLFFRCCCLCCVVDVNEKTK